MEKWRKKNVTANEICLQANFSVCVYELWFCHQKRKKN